MPACTNSNNVYDSGVGVSVTETAAQTMRRRSSALISTFGRALVLTHLPSIRRLSVECPVDDVREKCAALLTELASTVDTLAPYTQCVTVLMFGVCVRL